MINLTMTNIFEIYQNVHPMTIALEHQTYANLIFASVGQRRNAPKESIHVYLDNVNVVKMMNVYLQKYVLLENAEVSICQSPQNCQSCLHQW